MRGPSKLEEAFLAGLLLVSIILMLKPPLARAAPEKPNVEWSENGGSDYDWTGSIVQTSDGGFAIAGETESYGAGHEDFWLVKLSGKAPGKAPVRHSLIALAGILAVIAFSASYLLVRRRRRGL